MVLNKKLVKNMYFLLVIWNIFEYLPPIRLGWMGTLCKYFNEAVDDDTLWKIVAKNYESLFIWEKLYTTSVNDFRNTYGVYGDLASLKVSTNDRENDCSSVIQSSAIKPKTDYKQRISFIENMENPKEVIIKKIIDIKQIYKRQNDELIKKKEYDDYWTKKLNYYRHLSDSLLTFLWFFLAIGTTSFYLLLNLLMQNIISKNSQFWIMIPFWIFCAIFIIQILCLHFYYRDLKLGFEIFKIYLIAIIIVMTIIAFSFLLQRGSTLNWKLTFAPIQIFFLYMIFLVFGKYKDNRDRNLHETREWVVYISAIVDLLLLLLFFNSCSIKIRL
ncbi:f-box only protein [Anaeramoeba flamelloides]|uniref:F-box only protein n=1 Tax=Anaeramoeba flamelloides TaxID=1746091 RepID=A0AAV7Y956_9EUKA|nr:f-box only protein [Anaeramoeba flamelloides]